MSIKLTIMAAGTLWGQWCRKKDWYFTSIQELTCPLMVGSSLLTHMLIGEDKLNKNIVL